MNLSPSSKLLSLLALAAVLALAACGPVGTQAPTPEQAAATQRPASTEAEAPTAPSEEGEQPETEPNIMRIGWIEEPDCMFSYYHCATIFDFMPDLIMEGLKAFGPNCDSVPQLAESIDYSDDGLTITVHLREGATWSDGEPLDANDLAAFFDFVNRLDLAEWHVTTAHAESWRVVDDNTFEFTNSVPIAPEALESGAAVWDWVVPPQVYAEMDEDAFWDYGTDAPVTAGPYVLTEWNRGSYMIFDARPDYWAGKPPVDRVIVQFFANTDALVNALLSGEIDVIPDDILPQYYEELATDPNLEIVEQPAGRYLGLFFNMSTSGTAHPAIQDASVRESIDYAIDRQQIIDVSLFGKGVICPIGSACGPMYAKGLDPDLAPTPYDPDMAAQILDEQGYVDSDNDGIRESPDGEPLAFRLYFNQDFPPNQSASDLVSEYLSAVGIDAQPTAMEHGTLVSAAIYEHDFDMIISQEIPEIDPATDDWPWGCWSAEGGGGNISGYCNPELDDLVFQILTTTGAERTDLIQEEQRILASDRPEIFLAGITSIGAYRQDKFEIPRDACPYWIMLSGWYPLMNTTVK
jgi:peptide/nickel transport system substrate-binding protein